MKKAPNLFTFETLRSCTSSVSMSRDGKAWHPCRPLGPRSIACRIGCAWAVFTGRADALIWPGDQ